MSQALADQPATPFRVPPGVRLVRVDAATGLLPGPGTDTAILEAFLPGTEPSRASGAADGVSGADRFDGSGVGGGDPRPGRRAACRGPAVLYSRERSRALTTGAGGDRPHR